MKDRKMIFTDEIKFPWRQDKRGYFLIKIGNGKIHCGFVNNNHEMLVEFVALQYEHLSKQERRLQKQWRKFLHYHQCRTRR